MGGNKLYIRKGESIITIDIGEYIRSIASIDRNYLLISSRGLNPSLFRISDMQWLGSSEFVSSLITKVAHNTFACCNEEALFIVKVKGTQVVTSASLCSLS